MRNFDPFLANRTMWNETAAIHEKARLSALLQAVARDDFCTFDSVELRFFERLGLTGKSVAQPCCNNARELISVKRAGAARCVGFDFSPPFLAQGQRLADAARVEIELVNANVTDIPAGYFDCFDIVYVTVGVLGWLPDIGTFFSVVVDLLRPEGSLFLYEMHPALFLYDDAETSPADPRIARSYFQRDPIIFQDCSDYLDPTAIVAGQSYWYQHTLGEVLASILNAGLSLKEFEEHPHDVSGSYVAFEGQQYAIPMSYSLVARKAMRPSVTR